ncbi:hypothetical protein CDAR_440761 [Caerostris darwini]|uniref:Uncharacterized protein n=1 Tax=Caerostris darwini TaxID=1538125 RepID=A0AAV4ML36_9ARAC|nr:hypothetical protein CDAR_440761 [Caerostris darwini]
MRWPEFWLNLDIFVPPPDPFGGAKSLPYYEGSNTAQCSIQYWCFYSSVTAAISSNQRFHWLRKLAQFRWDSCSLSPFSYFLFFFPFFLMAQEEEDRKAIGGELESEMVVLSSATNG